MASVDGPAEPEPEAERFYPLRITEQAATDIDAASDYLTKKAGVAFAEQWEEGLFKEIRKLSNLPYKYDIALLETQRMKRETRDLTYRLKPGGVAYRIFYAIVESDLEPTSVVIIHVRHGSRRPITKKEGAALRKSMDF